MGIIKVSKVDEFLKAAYDIHQNKYTYPNLNFKTLNDRINIECLIHGIFSQQASSHLRGRGCKKCHFDKMRKCDDFIAKSKFINGNEVFDYSFVVEINSVLDKIKLKCKRCDKKFFTSYRSHIDNKAGCRKCDSIERGKSMRKSLEQFIADAKLVHGEDIYDYSKAIYVNCMTPIIVICRNHGEFIIRPNNHVSNKNGCPKCNYSKGELAIRNYLNNANIVFEPQKKYDDLRGKKNTKLEFDFYLPTYNLLIEFDGEQHFNKKCKWYNPQIKINDRLKNKYAKKNNIDLLRIKYIKIDKIDEILLNYLKIHKK
jgi:formylmethanofuran dehydrogenase subunit E